MQKRTTTMIWFVALLLVGGALLGACGGATPVAPVADDVAPTQVPPTVAPTAVEATATTAPTSVPDTATPAPATEDPTATAEPTEAPTATAEPTEVPPTEEAPEIDAVALLQDRCVACHNLARATGGRYTLEQWQQVVTRMIRHGAVLNDEEQAALVAYLAETYGP